MPTASRRSPTTPPALRSPTKTRSSPASASGPARFWPPPALVASFLGATTVKAKGLPHGVGWAAVVVLVLPAWRSPRSCWPTRKLDLCDRRLGSSTAPSTPTRPRKPRTAPSAGSSASPTPTKSCASKTLGGSRSCRSCSPAWGFSWCFRQLLWLLGPLAVKSFARWLPSPLPEQDRSRSRSRSGSRKAAAARPRRHRRPTPARKQVALDAGRTSAGASAGASTVARP